MIDNSCLWWWFLCKRLVRPKQKLLQRHKSGDELKQADSSGVFTDRVCCESGTRKNKIITWRLMEGIGKRQNKVDGWVWFHSDRNEDVTLKFSCYEPCWIRSIFPHSWCCTLSLTTLILALVSCLSLFFLYILCLCLSALRKYKSRMCVSVLMGGLRRKLCVLEEKGLLLFLLPAVLPQEQPASVRLHVIDRHAFSSMRIGSDLKQALPFLTEWLPAPPSLPKPPSISEEQGWEGHEARWLQGQQARVIQVCRKGNCHPCVWAHVLQWEWEGMKRRGGGTGGGLHSSEWKANTTLKSCSVCPRGDTQSRSDSHWTNSI